MSLIKLFSDELSVLNNRESLYKIHPPRANFQDIFETPPHNIGTDNLLIFVDGILKIKNIDYVDIGSTSVRFNVAVNPQSTISMLLIRTGADYTYGNTAISQFHHSMADPIPDSGKNDDYHLNISTGDLFSKTNGIWTKIYSIGSGGTGTGGGTSGGIAPFCKLSYISLSYTRFANTTTFEIPPISSSEMPLLFINGFLMVYGRDYTIEGEKFLTFNDLITIDKDIILYKVAKENNGGNYSLISQSLANTRSTKVNSVTFTGEIKDGEQELVYLNGFLMIKGRDYIILNSKIIFTFYLELNWDVLVYKLGNGEIFGIADLILTSAKNTRDTEVDTFISPSRIDIAKDSLFLYYNGFLMASGRDYDLVDETTIKMKYNIKKDVDIVIYRWSNRIPPQGLEWNIFNF